nr:uncharacterized protein LOC122273070 [Parasteatoda tepidariorum]
MPSSQGFSYCLTCIDRYTRWTEAIPLTNIQAETVAQALYTHWFARYGIPEGITTDRGSQFRSELFRTLAKNFGIRLSYTTSYHPQANGMIERWHRVLKPSIMCHTSIHWTFALPAVLLGLRSVYREDLGCSPAELVYGENLRLPGQFFTSSEIEKVDNMFLQKLNRHLQDLNPVPTSSHDKRHVFIFKDLVACTHVFLRVNTVKPTLHTPYTGPYEVYSRNDKTFTIRIKGKNCVVSIDRVKPAHLLSDSSDLAEPKRFSHINIDLVGPMPSSQGFSYCLTCIDRYTRWTEAIPLTNIQAETVAQALYTHWFARYGIPEGITTDRGSQFRSELFRTLAKNFGIRLSYTTSYHPQANGMIERWHRVLKQSIMCHTSIHWTFALPAVLLGLRSVYREDLGCSPAELVYGENLRLPGQFFTSSEKEKVDNMFMQKLNRHLQDLKPVPTSSHDKRHVFVFKDLAACTHVFLRVDAAKPTLHTPYTGPYEVYSRNDKTFTIRIKGKNCVVSIDRVKPAHLLSDSSDLAEPPDIPSKLVHNAPVLRPTENDRILS